MASELILISERSDDQQFAAQVAMTAGLSLKTLSNPREAAALIAETDVSAGSSHTLFVDASNLDRIAAVEAAIQEAVGMFSDKINPNTIHFLCSEELSKIAEMVNSPLFGHYVMRNEKNVELHGSHYGRIVRATLMNRAFGLKNLLGDQAKIQEIKIEKASLKQSAVEAVKNYLLQAKFQSRMASVVANAVDEILMNAMYDAPVDSLGKHVFTSTKRNTEIELVDRHQVEMHVGFDGEYVAVSAIDLFGSLDKAKLLKHICKMYNDEEYRVRTTVAGAGIGLATVFRLGGSFFFVSESSTRTEVSVFFRRTKSFKQFKDQFRFLSTQFYF